MLGSTPNYPFEALELLYKSFLTELERLIYDV